MTTKRCEVCGVTATRVTSEMLLREGEDDWRPHFYHCDRCEKPDSPLHSLTEKLSDVEMSDEARAIVKSMWPQVMQAMIRLHGDPLLVPPPYKKPIKTLSIDDARSLTAMVNENEKGPALLLGTFMIVPIAPGIALHTPATEEETMLYGDNEIRLMAADGWTVIVVHI